MTIGGFDESAKEHLSALADGELDEAGLAACCRAWSKDERLRADWHTWHVIGDILRSDDLAAPAARDRRLLLAVRARLEREAVVLAPAPLAPTAPPVRRQRPGWAAGAAVAAGVVLVVGTMAVLRPGEAPPAARVALVDAGPPQSTAAAGATSVADNAAPAEVVVANQKMIRDAQLDRYLDAHKQFAGSSALGVPSAFLRSATVDSASR